jgi:hypothetical protein
MELDWNNGALADGLRAFRNGEFFLAHEYWEQRWINCDQPEKTFVQALIQTACALHHFQRNNLRGAASLFDRALVKLQSYPAQFAGVEVAPLREQIGSWILALAGPQPASWPPLPELHLCPQEPGP